MTIEKERVDETPCEDEFEDAVEATELTEETAEELIKKPIATTTAPATAPNVNSLESALEEIHHCLVIALDNHFEEALKITQQKSETSIYHSVGQTFLYFLKGVLTLEKDQVEKALNSATHLFELCSKERRPNYLGVIWRPNYNNYSDIEVHSELCYAESLLMVALLTFLENQNLINLVKGAFRIRSCFAAYRECQNILNTKTNWQSERSRRDFEAGVRMGVGTFNLMVSHLPSKVLKVLEYIGFSGNRSIGLQEIEISVSMKDCLRSPISALISATYHCYVEHYFGLGDGDVDYTDKMLAGWLKYYPNSAFFLLFKGRIAVLKGELNDACVSFEKCINIQAEWRQLHNICIWELLWCYCIKCDWQNAIKYADILRKQCVWSPAIYCYQSAIFTHMMMDETGDERLREKINELYREVPKLRIRYAGKTIPAEKFAITHAEKYFVTGEHLLLPAIEYIYIWNLFAIIEKDKRLITPILDRVEKKIGQYKNEIESDQLSTDNICLLMLLKGVCLRTLGYPYQALESLQQVLKHEKQISLSTWIPPHCSMEIGLTYIRLNEFELANHWFEKAKKDYSGYLLETLLHFRVHCGQRLIKKAKKKQAEIEASLEIEAALEIQQKQQVKLINEQASAMVAEETVKEQNQVNNLKNGNVAEESAASPTEDEKLKQIIKLKSKFNESLKIEDKLITEYIAEAVEVSSNNL